LFPAPTPGIFLYGSTDLVFDNGSTVHPRSHKNKPHNTLRLPVRTTTIDRRTTQGAESVSQCKCSPGFYDTLGGSGDRAGEAPLCSACPDGSVGWGNAGAIGVAACTCPAGRYLDEASKLCVECEAGTYKVREALAQKRRAAFAGGGSSLRDWTPFETLWSERSVELLSVGIPGSHRIGIRRFVSWSI